VTRAALLALAVVPLVVPWRIARGGCVPAVTAPVRLPDAPPELVAVWLSQPDYRWGDLARIRVVASTNVALVELRVGPYGRALTKRAPGQFSGVYRFPFLPPFVHPRWTLTFRFVARTTAGVTTVRELPVALH
jgi:hypothetical protein